MPFQATAYRVLIASPGDLPEERDATSEEVHAWNAAHALATKAVLLPVRWETHAAPEMGGRPQGILNDRLVSNCDVLVGLFWTRLGTPTGEAESGTAEEIQQFMDSGRRVLLYFSNRPVELGSVDLEQYQKLKQFKASLRDKGLLGEFSSVDELRRKLNRDLVGAMHDIHNAPSEQSQGSDADAGTGIQTALTPDVRVTADPGFIVDRNPFSKSEMAKYLNVTVKNHSPVIVYLSNIGFEMKDRMRMTILKDDVTGTQQTGIELPPGQSHTVHVDPERFREKAPDFVRAVATDAVGRVYQSDEGLFALALQLALS